MVLLISRVEYSLYKGNTVYKDFHKLCKERFYMLFIAFLVYPCNDIFLHNVHKAVWDDKSCLPWFRSLIGWRRQSLSNRLCKWLSWISKIVGWKLATEIFWAPYRGGARVPGVCARPRRPSVAAPLIYISISMISQPQLLQCLLFQWFYYRLLDTNGCFCS